MRLSPPHPLYPAQLRVRRARQSIGTLRRQFQRWTDAQTETLRSFKQVGPTEFMASRDDPPVELLFRAAVTIGEVAYNCRAALDYLVYELARGNNKGKPVGGTQFPIERSEPWYWARWTGKHPTDPGKTVARHLNKVPKKAADILRDFQPFAGCEWTELLQEISNTDKHRFVTLISSKEDFRNAQLDIVAGTVTGTLAVRVVFEHDRELDVVRALRVIHDGTSSLIDAFAPAFVGRPDNL